MEDKKARSKADLLKDFTKIIHRHDPMGVKSPHEDEYEAEALSILSRLTELSVHLADDEDAAIEAAHSVVLQTFQFWFDELANEIEVMDLTHELLHVYVTSYPQAPTDIPLSEQDQPDHVIVKERQPVVQENESS